MLREPSPSEQAAQAEKAGEWFAAAFHLDRLLLDKPNDANLLRRRDTARDNLQRAQEQMPPPMTKLPP